MSRDRSRDGIGHHSDQSVSQHLHIGIETIRILEEEVTKGEIAVHSRKLRTFDEPPFR